LTDQILKLTSPARALEPEAGAEAAGPGRPQSRRSPTRRGRFASLVAAVEAVEAAAVEAARRG